MTASCPLCASRINPGPEVDTYAAWQARIASTQWALMRWFQSEYPDTVQVIADRQKALSDEIAALRPKGRRKDGAA